MITIQRNVLRPAAWLDGADAVYMPFLTDAESREMWMCYTPYIANLENVRLLPYDWLLLGEHGLLIESLDPMMPLNPAKARHVAAFADGLATLHIPEREVVVDEPCVLLGNHSSHYHWLLYYLPRLISRERMPELGRLRLVVGDNILPQQVESLRLLGIGESQLMQLSGDAVYRFETLWVPSALMDRMHVHPAVLRWLRRTFIGSESPRPRGRRLMTSRRDAPSRHLVNEEEIAAALAPLGFELLRCGELGFAEQVRLFSESEAVVGGTGSALSNAVFVPAGALMMELHNYHAARFLDFLCMQLGQYYERVVGELDDSTSDVRVHIADFRIPLDSVMARLRMAGISRRRG